MGERRFFAANGASDGQVVIEGEEYHHVVRVMRHRVGDEVEIVNGRGRLLHGRIAAIHSRSLRVDVRAVEDFPEPPPRVVVAPSLTRGNAMDWMVEKLAEMGVDEVRPLSCQRTDVTYGGAQLRRWQKIAAQALKVNRRYWLTRIFPPVSPAELVAAAGTAPVRILLDAAAADRLRRPRAFPVLSVIGPPGDFSADEKSLFRANGFLPARINDAVLRTETAALAVAAIVKND